MNKKNTKIFFDPWVLEGLKLLATEHERSCSAEINYACKKYVEKNLTYWKELKVQYETEK